MLLLGMRIALFITGGSPSSPSPALQQPKPTLSFFPHPSSTASPSRNPWPAPCHRLAVPPLPFCRSSAPLFYYYHCCLISTFRVAASCPFFPSDRARVRLFCPCFPVPSFFLLFRLPAGGGRGEFISNPKRLRDTVVDRELFPMCSELNDRFTLFRRVFERSAAQTGATRRIINRRMLIVVLNLWPDFLR